MSPYDVEISNLNRSNGNKLHKVENELARLKMNRKCIAKYDQITSFKLKEKILISCVHYYCTSFNTYKNVLAGFANIKP